LQGKNQGGDLGDTLALPGRLTIARFGKGIEIIRDSSRI